MSKMENIVGILNELLAAEVLDNGLLERSVSQFNDLCEQQKGGKDVMPGSINKAIHKGIVLMDFELHTEEKECITYLRFKMHYGLEKSTFVIMEGFLIYAYFGNARNDQSIRGYLDKGKWLKIIKIY